MSPQDPPLPGWMQGSPAVQTLARTLLARYPAAFRAEGAEVRPLKIGIDRDLQQALDVDPAVLRTVLGGYTRRRAYRAALAAPGAMRVDLAGQPVEPVTAAQQQWARQAPPAPPPPAPAHPGAGGERVTAVDRGSARGGAGGRAAGGGQGDPGGGRQVPSADAALSREARGAEAACPDLCGSYAPRRRTRPPPLQGVAPRVGPLGPCRLSVASLHAWRGGCAGPRASPRARWGGRRQEQ